MSRKQKFHDPLNYTFGEVLIGIANENKPEVLTINARPFLKWVGGKRSILSDIIVRMPKTYEAYYEPFLGGGALYFSVQPQNAFLSDVNFHLIITFRAVRDDVENLIKLLKVHESKHSKPYFLEARDNLFTENNQTAIAAWFIYLNKTCFNGLYRVNNSGKFNVPMGDYKVPAILDEENLRNASKVLQTADISQTDFNQIPVKKNCFYYLDPPYHETFNGYNGGGFGEDEHRTLAKFCVKIHKAGGHFILSNSDTDLIRSLYKDFTIDQVSASRSVSCKAHQRGKENELIIRNC